jgi:hypothetical protein
MKKGFVLLFSLLVFGLVIGGTMWHNANSFAQIVIPPEGGTTELDWKLNQIDEKALEAQGNEEPAVRELADEVFNKAAFAIIPVADREAMKERVLNAEMDYRNGRSEGIAEENIVQTVNELADKLNAPDFARTSALQVRVLRAGLLNDYPNFIAQDTTSGEIGVLPADGGEPSWGVAIGDSVSSTMSPLEAVYVTALMLEQKILNESYQYTPEEWVDEVYNKAVTQWQADQQAEPPSGEPGEAQAQTRLTASGDNAKRAQMVQACIASAPALLYSESQNPSDSPNLYDATLDTLGIQR